MGIPIIGLPTLLLNTLQFDSVNETFIWVAGPVSSLGDLEFIQEKVLANNYFQVSGLINALTNTIEFIVPDSKTAFLIEAKIIIPTHSNPPIMPTGATNTIVSDRVQAELLINAITKDTTNIGVVMNATTNNIGDFSSGSSGSGFIGDGKFNTKGLSLIGDGAKKIEIKNTLDAGSAFATLSGYLIDT